MMKKNLITSSRQRLPRKLGGKVCGIPAVSHISVEFLTDLSNSQWSTSPSSSWHPHHHCYCWKACQHCVENKNWGLSEWGPRQAYPPHTESHHKWEGPVPELWLWFNKKNQVVGETPERWKDHIDSPLVVTTTLNKCRNLVDHPRNLWAKLGKPEEFFWALDNAPDNWNLQIVNVT